MNSAFLQDRGNGVFSIRITGQDGRSVLTRDLSAQLRRALDEARRAPDLKVLVLEGSPGTFLSGGRTQCNDALEEDLFRSIAAFPYPVIAALRGDATGAGLLLAAVCDFAVCNVDASYRFSNPVAGFFPTPAEARLFAQRFGRARAMDFLCLAAVSTGAQLRDKGWSVPIVPAAQVEPHAMRLASSLAQKPQTTVRLLKEHLARRSLERVRSLAWAVSDGLEPRARPASAAVSATIGLLQLQSAGDGILIVRGAANGQADVDTRASAEQLIALLARPQAVAGAPVRALVLAGVDWGSRLVADESIVRLQDALERCALPVIGALGTETSARGWLIGQMCDVPVYARQGRFGVAGLLDQPALAELAMRALPARCGIRAARDLVLARTGYSGDELQRRLGPWPMVDESQLETEALRVARCLARLPAGTIAAMRPDAGSADGDVSPEDGTVPAQLDAESGARPGAEVIHATDVIDARVDVSGIVMVRMEDRDSKNLFSERLVRSLREVFEKVGARADCKVIVLTGYDSYFACGGTKEALLAIQDGRARFTDDRTWQRTLNCALPVVAAMQGHGIGGGWSLGLFADFTLLSDESKYLSPYLAYGFTPGAGATFIVPEMLGRDLGWETLLTAQEYSGAELEGRGAGLDVHSRKQIHAAAMELAGRIARHSRADLISFKRCLNRPIHGRLEPIIRQEIAMHERTFVGQTEALNQIQTTFDPTGAAAPSDDVLVEIRRLLAEELHMRVEDADEDTQFIDLGLDSITGVTWMRKINERYGTSILATKVYSFPTLTKLAGYVRDEIARLAPRLAGSPAATPVVPVHTPVAVAAPAPTPHAAPNPTPNLPIAESRPAALKARTKLPSWRDQKPSRLVETVPVPAPPAAPTAVVETQPATERASSPVAGEPIAIIGMAGQFPKSRTLEDYWNNIAHGRNCISEIPTTRWDVDAYFEEKTTAAGKTNSKWMGLLEEFDRFDPLFFEISPKEALSMDPQQRVFLQSCWHAIESAGYNPKSLSARKCGVFVGCGPGDYHLLSRDLQTSALGFTGTDTSILAARVSYFLDLHGPCLSIETACSSSLVAIATACDSLIARNSDLALAGGVYVMSGPDLHLKTTQMGMLSDDGRCFTFDQRANGFVPGEGVGTVLLKRLSDAQRDGDTVLAVIAGWGVNQDGKTNGITAPNPESQARLQQQVYERHQIDPAGIQLIEAHGTGTKLGDPIEIDALRQSFGRFTRQTNYCALGSVKSNIGHCFTAAGVASTIKVVQALRHRQLPPTINYQQLNEHIRLDDSPFYVNDRLRDWELHGAPRRQGAISGFGFGGTNAHLVLAEYAAPDAPSAVTTTRENGRIIFPLSARTPERLRDVAKELLEFVSRSGPEKGHAIDLVGVAYTLQTGREPMDARLAFLAGSVEELAAKLAGYLRGDTAGICQARVSENKETMSVFRGDEDLKETVVGRLSARAQLSKLLELWVKGLTFDWNRLYATRPQRVALPLYPFAKDRYWIEPAQLPGAAGHARATSALHPLLHQNVSSFREQCFSSVFRGSEPILEQNVLPAGACLEMARVAAVLASEGRGSIQHVGVAELRDVAWGQSFHVRPEDAQGTEISIALFANDDDTIDFEIYSRAGDEAIVHAQGAALLTAQTQRLRIDLAQIRERVAADADQQLLKSFSLSAAETSAGDYGLQPALLGRVLAAWAELRQSFDEALVPCAARQVRILSACPKDVIAWARAGQSDAATLDIDLCDADGSVCVEIRALALRPVSEAAAVASALGTATAVSAPAVEGVAAPAPAPAPAATPTHAQFVQELRASVAQALYLKPADISVDRPFIELGLDSIVGVEWVGELNKAYNLKLTATRLYDYPNVTELATYIEKECRNSRATVVVTAVANEKPVLPAVHAAPAATRSTGLKRASRARRTRRGHAPAGGKIAIVGIAGKYPQAGNLTQFWENLAAGRDSITEVPPSRWDVTAHYDPDRSKRGKTYCKWIGLLDDIDCFDPLFFKISPAEAKGMDPQHRLFLEESYKAFEDAGYSGKALSQQKCGVYLGTIGNEYGSLVAQSAAGTADLTGNCAAIGAARVAYFLNLKGPAISIDTACSSSLVAIHLACQGLMNHETDMALAGGVTVYLKPDTYLGMSQAGMLSADGRCKTFDDAANGFVPGEGVGVVVLKRLEDAVRDGDRIHGVILGSGINQDGKTNGITAPSVQSQCELVREVYARHDIDPETISYIETHGTGTKLGDPIELEALSTAFREKTAKKNYCGLGSVKSNVGHTSGAAGVAGVHKVLLAMAHRTLPPTLNVKKENTLFDFGSSPFYIAREKQAWNTGDALRRAGVSSFGFSGTNAHLVLEEYVAPAAARRGALAAIPASGVAIPLSARTAEQLQQKVRDLLEFLRRESSRVDLIDFAHSVQTGRDAMDERLGFIAHSVSELVDKLAAYVADPQAAAGTGLQRGRVERGEDGVSVHRCDPNADLPQRVQGWVRGAEVEWPASGGRRIALPSYPFARKRYWVDRSAVPAAPTQASAAASQVRPRHPLLHKDTSVLGAPGFAATFSGDEPFLVAPRSGADAVRVLPAAAYLEMARAAIEQAFGVRDDAGSPQLHDVIWGRPLAASATRQVNIALFKRGDTEIDFEIYSISASQDPSDEIVHCQGHARRTRAPALARLDLRSVEGTRDARQCRTRVDLPGGPDDYLLHPGLLHAALRDAQAWLGGQGSRLTNDSLPLAVQSAAFVSGCEEPAFASVRIASGAGHPRVLRLDIDVCDAQGNVCVALRGVDYEQEQVAVPAPQPQTVPTPTPTPTPMATMLPAMEPVVPKPVARGSKPSVKLDTFIQAAPVAPKRPLVTLELPGI